jgi:glutaminyl-peptide cyclotransferase
MSKSRTRLYLAAIGVLLLLVSIWYLSAFLQRSALPSGAFDGARALRDVETQVAFGPRTPNSTAHAKVLDWMKTELMSAGWQVQIQSLVSQGHPVLNLIAFRSPQPPQILLGAHYDSRIHADRDPNPALHDQPVPGADDGASGVAVLIGLGRSLPRNSVPVWLVFFDAEDNGNIPGWDWLLGSKSFVANMTARPQEMILVDMVGDRDLNIPMEAYSDPRLRASIWQTAAGLGYGAVFLPTVKYRIEDDHLPFVQAGIPAVDIIDLDYAYWHTTSDTPDHVSAQSLQTVGNVLRTWLMQQSPASSPDAVSTPSPAGK